jgi:hypothetical protein
VIEVRSSEGHEAFFADDRRASAEGYAEELRGIGARGVCLVDVPEGALPHRPPSS